MKQHAVERLQQRFNMDKKEFYQEYINSVAKGKFFKKDFQDPVYPSFNVCVVIRRKLVGLALKKDGTIITVLKPQFADYQKAYDLGWSIVYPELVWRDLEENNESKEKIEEN